MGYQTATLSTVYIITWLPYVYEIGNGIFVRLGQLCTHCYYPFFEVNYPSHLIFSAQIFLLISIFLSSITVLMEEHLCHATDTQCALGPRRKYFLSWIHPNEFWIFPACTHGLRARVCVFVPNSHFLTGNQIGLTSVLSQSVPYPSAIQVITKCNIVWLKLSCENWYFYFDKPLY